MAKKIDVKQELGSGLPPEEVQATSEFGRGLVICLTKFAEHFSNDFADQVRDVHFWRTQLNQDDSRMAEYDRKISENVKWFREVYLKTSIEISHESGEVAINSALSRVIELWANGASDHLYEMTIPQEWENTEIATKVAELKDLGLSMGHGFVPDRIWTFDDFQRLFYLTHEIALMIDRRIGISNAEEGEY